VATSSVLIRSGCTITLFFLFIFLLVISHLHICLCFHKINMFSICFFESTKHFTKNLPHNFHKWTPHFFSFSTLYHLKNLFQITTEKTLFKTLYRHTHCRDTCYKDNYSWALRNGLLFSFIILPIVSPVYSYPYGLIHFLFCLSNTPLFWILVKDHYPWVLINGHFFI
jgi:hypothetical protein